MQTLTMDDEFLIFEICYDMEVWFSLQQLFMNMI